MTTRICMFFTVLATTFAVVAVPPQQATATKKAPRVATVKLNDGTSVQGQIVSLDDGVYLVDTTSLGRLKIPVERILGISYSAPAAEQAEKQAAAPKPPPVPAPEALPAVDNAQMQQMMQNMLGNPEIMQLIQQLSEDPAIQEMVNDPQLQKAINNGQYFELLTHPGVRSMMDNPTVQKITEEVKEPKAKTPEGNAPAKSDD